MGDVVDLKTRKKKKELDEKIKFLDRFKIDVPSEKQKEEVTTEDTEDVIKIGAYAKQEEVEKENFNFSDTFKQNDDAKKKRDLARVRHNELIKKALKLNKKKKK